MEIYMLALSIATGIVVWYANNSDDDIGGR